MQEVWKDIPGYEGRYKVSNLGRVAGLPCCSRSTTRILKPNLKKSGYLNILLCKGGIVKTHRIHRLVAQAFLPNPENKETVNHKNGVKSDNRLCNLEWATQGENTQHAYNCLGRQSHGGVAKKAVRCKETGEKYASIHEAERLTRVARASISNSIRNNTVGGGLHWEYA